MTGFETKNSKYRCVGCGSIFDRPLSVLGPGACDNCGGTDMEQIVTHPMCDFCGVDRPGWSFPCGEFLMMDVNALFGEDAVGPDRASKGPWLACEVCKDLIDEGRIDELSRRSTDLFVKEIPEAVPNRRMLEDVNATAFRNFMAHRAGPAEPWTP